MTFPVGLALYLFATARRAAPGREEMPEPPERPPGALVHLALDHPPTTALAELVERLLDTPEPPEILVTAPEGPGAAPLPEEVWRAPPPPATLPDTRAFLGHWRPDLILIAGDSLPPALLREADRAHLPVMMIDARPPRPGHPRRFPGVVGTLLHGIRGFAAPDPVAARALRRLGAPEARIEVVGALHEPPVVLPHVEAEREAPALVAHARPIWLVAGLPEAEEDWVIEAHRQALRRAHRLLLIAVPADPARGPALAAKMEATQRWTVPRRGADEEPEEEAQAYIADTEGEMGLWYRLAPITLMGGTLSMLGSTRSPLEPAALGSAILHGPHPGAYGPSYARLGAAGATRLIPRPADLAGAVSEMVAPDRAARLARNAWEASTAGAEVTERVVAMILAALYRAGREMA